MLPSQYMVILHSRFAVKGWQLQTGMCKSRTGNILPYCSSLFSLSLSSSFSIFYFTCRNGRGLKMLKVCDVTEWLPYVNINLSFVTMLCRPWNHKICFTCQYNLDPSKRRHSSIQRHIGRKILLLKHFNTHPSKSPETLCTTLHEMFEDHILWELVNMHTYLLIYATNHVLCCALCYTCLNIFRVRFIIFPLM
jgi:hypothetical protein